MRRSAGTTMAIVGLVVLTLVSRSARAGADDGSAPPDDRLCPADLTVEAQAGTVLVALVADPAAVPGLLDAIAADALGGIAPLGSLVDDLDDAAWAGIAASPGLFASDEEGGQVQRFRGRLGRLPSAREQVDTMSTDEVRSMYADYGRGLADDGVAMAFAPVVDVGGGPAIGNRSYGSDPAVVVDYAAAAIDGYLDAGLTPVIKHFPGHGRASADTHDGAATTPPLADLRSVDLVPFAELASDDVAVMVGHLDVPDLTDGGPASLSHAAITGLLRDELGFDGLVVSDALGMGAIRQVATGPDAAVMFLRAGGDMALVDAVDVDATRAAIVAAVETGALEPLRLHAAVTRVERVTAPAEACPTPWDLTATAVVRGALLPFTLTT